MKNKLSLLFCDYFQQEVECLLQAKHYPDVKAVFYRADCDKTCQSPTVLEMIAQQAKTDSVIVFAGYCLSLMLKERVNADLQIEPLEICFELLLPPTVLQQTLAEGAHLFTNGMLKHWPQINQRWGFDNVAKKTFFAEGTTKLVLITHPHCSADETMMAEVARQLGVRWEKLEISLDHLAARILPLINHWQSKKIADKYQPASDSVF
jgi:hypothetical protein